MTTTFQTVFAGQGESPVRMIYMVTDQNLATITAAGFLNKYSSGNGYVFSETDVLFVFYAGTFGIFNVAISDAGVITLSLNADIPAGSIVNSMIAADAEIAYSKLADLTTGSMLLGVNGTATVTPIASYVKYSGKQNNGGGSATVAITVTGLTTSDLVFAQVQASTNAVTVQKVTPTANTLTVLLSGDPGASTVITWYALRRSS